MYNYNNNNYYYESFTKLALKGRADIYFVNVFHCLLQLLMKCYYLSSEGFCSDKGDDMAILVFCYITKFAFVLKGAYL